MKRKSDSTAWLDKNGRPWLDPHHRDIWAYAGDLGEEAIALGFGEVQFDYVRFPDEPRLIREATFPLAKGRVRARVIREQLGYLHERFASRKVPMAIDVFGLTATDSTDMGIGQRWEQFVDQADVVLPMTYPSHYAPGTYGLGNPNAHPYAVLDHSLRDAKRRSAGIADAGKLVPWYQDFTLGPPHYGARTCGRRCRRVTTTACGAGCCGTRAAATPRPRCVRQSAGKRKSAPQARGRGHDLADVPRACVGRQGRR